MSGLTTLGLVTGCADPAPPNPGEHETVPPSRAEYSAGHEDIPPTADEAWHRLEDGNARFASGSARHPHQDAAWRQAVAPHQAPYAFVLGCIDSRVPVETVFDQGVGDVFVGRNPAAILDDTVIGGIEFAVSGYQLPLVVIMGHTACGAVKATVDAVKANPAAPTAPGEILDVAREIMPAVQATAENGDGSVFVDAVACTNTRRVVDLLVKRSGIVADAVRAGTLQVIAANYQLTTGRVERL